MFNSVIFMVLSHIVHGFVPYHLIVLPYTTISSCPILLYERVSYHCIVLSHITLSSYPILYYSMDLSHIVLWSCLMPLHVLILWSYPIPPIFLSLIALCTYPILLYSFIPQFCIILHYGLILDYFVILSQIENIVYIFFFQFKYSSTII